MLQDSEVVDKCLRALKALGSYHHKETITGNVGLGSQASGVKDSMGNVLEGILSRFLPSLLQLLLFEDYRYNLILNVDTLAPIYFEYMTCVSPTCVTNSVKDGSFDS